MLGFIITLTKIKKVTSGSTDAIATVVDDLYKSIITAGTHKAPSIKVAEASKAIENAQRDVNISFVNELAPVIEKLLVVVALPSSIQPPEALPNTTL